LQQAWSLWGSEWRRNGVLGKGRGNPDWDKRGRYFALMSQGLSNSAACRELGIFRRTGTRWLHGQWRISSSGERYVVRSLKSMSSRAVSGGYLSEDERITIADGVARQTQCAFDRRGVGRSPSTVSREIARNRDADRVVLGRLRPRHPDGSERPRDKPKLAAGEYHPHRAEQRARTRRQLHAWVQARLLSVGAPSR